MPDGLLSSARSALASGDVLMAYDAAVSAMEADPESLESAFVAALALARAGASERARTAATDLLARIDITTDVPMKLREDAAALEARLAKQVALATQGDDRPALYDRLLICMKQLPTGMDASTRASTRPRCACWRATSKELAS